LSPCVNGGGSRRRICWSLSMIITPFSSLEA
jgi:hypothetical protein